MDKKLIIKMIYNHGKRKGDVDIVTLDEACELILDKSLWRVFYQKKEKK